MQIIERYDSFDSIPPRLRENYQQVGQSWVLSHVTGLLRKNSELVRELAAAKNELRAYRESRTQVVSAVEQLAHIGK